MKFGIWLKQKGVEWKQARKERRAEKIVEMEQKIEYQSQKAILEDIKLTQQVKKLKLKEVKQELYAKQQLLNKKKQEAMGEMPNLFKLTGFNPPEQIEQPNHKNNRGFP